MKRRSGRRRLNRREVRKMIDDVLEVNEDLFRVYMQGIVLSSLLGPVLDMDDYREYLKTLSPADRRFMRNLEISLQKSKQWRSVFPKGIEAALNIHGDGFPDALESAFDTLDKTIKPHLDAIRNDIAFANVLINPPGTKRKARNPQGSSAGGRSA